LCEPKSKRKTIRPSAFVFILPSSTDEFLSQFHALWAAQRESRRHAGHAPPAIFQIFLSQPATSELLPSFQPPQTPWTTTQTLSASHPDAARTAFSRSFPQAMAMQNAPAGPQSSKPPAPSTWRFAPARPGSPLPARPPTSDVCICTPANPDPCCFPAIRPSRRAVCPSHFPLCQSRQCSESTRATARRAESSPPNRPALLIEIPLPVLARYPAPGCPNDWLSPIDAVSCTRTNRPVTAPLQ